MRNCISYATMNITPKLEEILQNEYALPLSHLHRSEELYFIDCYVGYGSRVYTDLRDIGEENISGERPRPDIKGTFYASIMRHNVDQTKYLIAVWSVLAWKGEHYLMSLCLSTNDNDYLITRMLQSPLLEHQRKNTLAAFHSLPPPKIMG